MGFIKEVPEEFWFTEAAFISTISMEYQRATRGNQHLSIVKLKINTPDISKCFYKIKNHTRQIDITGIYKNNIILILPITNETGASAVYEKLKLLLADGNIELQEGGLYTFYGDSSRNTKEFIHATLAFAQ